MMRDYMVVPTFLVMVGIVASLLILPDTEDMRVMRDGDAKRFGPQTTISFKVASSQY